MTRAWWGALGLVALGGGTSAYLLARSFALMGNAVSGVPDACRIVFGSSCDATLAGDASRMLGIPLAGWGIVYFATLACLLLLGRALRSTFHSEATLAFFVLTIPGAGVSLVLSATMILGSPPVCPFCLVVHAANLTLLPLAKRLTGRPLGELARMLGAAGMYLAGRDPDDGRLAAWKVVGFVNVAFVAVLVYQWVFVETALREHAARDVSAPEKVIAAYESFSPREIPVSDDDPRLGSNRAPVRMVVFASFQCPGCRRLAGELPRLKRHFSDDLAIVFKHYPLSNKCNERIRTDRQPLACRAARAAQAAYRQGRFWPFHDAVFSDGLQRADAIHEIAARVDLDLDRFAREQRSAEVARQVAQDVALGTKLQIRSTPAVFLNGRPVRPARANILRTLIQHELNKEDQTPVSLAERSD